MVCEICNAKNEELGLDVEFQGEPVKTEYEITSDGEYVKLWFRSQCSDCGRIGLGFKRYKLPEEFDYSDFEYVIGDGCDYDSEGDPL